MVLLMPEGFYPKVALMLKAGVNKLAFSSTLPLPSLVNDGLFSHFC